MARTDRLEFRVDPDLKSELERAAAVSGETVSDFARRAAAERAELILRYQHVTVVPPDFFDDLLSSLDEADKPNERLRRAAARDRAEASGGDR